jgi:hypothetical protein
LNEKGKTMIKKSMLLLLGVVLIPIHSLEIRKFDIPDSVGNKKEYDQYCMISPDANWCLNWKTNENGHKDTLIVWELGKKDYFPVYVDTNSFSNNFCSWANLDKINCQTYEVRPQTFSNFLIEIKPLLQQIKAGSGVTGKKNETGLASSTLRNKTVMVYAINGSLLRVIDMGDSKTSEIPDFFKRPTSGVIAVAAEKKQKN